MARADLVREELERCGFINLKVTKGKNAPWKKPNMLEEERKFKAAMEALPWLVTATLARAGS